MLHVDGYAGFERLTANGDIVLAACRAHTRRKSYEIVEATGSTIAQINPFGLVIDSPSVGALSELRRSICACDNAGGRHPQFGRKKLMANSLIPGSPLHLRLARFLLGLLSAVLLVALALVLLPLITHYFKHANSYWWIETVETFDARMIRWIKSVVPTNFKGHELARWFLVGGILVGRIWVDNLRRKVSIAIYRRAMQRDFEALKSAAPAGADERVLAPVKEKMKAMDARSAKSRAELLKVMAEAKRQLESMGRDLAFLSIDVVDSTKMKLGEDKTFIEHDFHEYKNLVDGKLRSNGSLKAAWTPDGVMACFPTIDAALKAAKEVISGLDAFNAKVKMIKSNFTVRCGVNAGHVYYDEQTPMEEMSDRVIDIAGHMQKYALPGTIACAKQIIEPVQQRGGFNDAGKVVDGYEVYQWTPAACLEDERAAS